MKFRTILGLPGLLILLLACGKPADAQPTLSYEALREGFKNPPIHARPKVYWWWLNGYTDSVRLKQELRAIKDAGLGGVDLFEIGLPPASDPNNIIPAGPAFMSDSSLKMIKLAVDEAGKLGLELGLNVASSWNAGGSWVKPQQATKTLYFSKTMVKSPGPASIALPFPTITPDRQGKPRAIAYAKDGRPAYREEVAVLAVPAGRTNLADTASILNLSSRFDPVTERLAWTAPAGEWEVYRYICSNSGEQLIRPSPNSQGPILDHFDSTATRVHLMHFIDRLKPLLGDFNKSSLKYLYLASYEAKEFTWTPTLPAAFRKLNGYDVYKLIPAIFNKTVFDPKITSRFEYDFSKTLSELMIHNHYRKAREICNRHGLQIVSEAGGPGHLHHIPVETLKALGSLDIPRGEYWYNRTFFDKDSVVDLLWLVKEIAAASHIYKRGMVEEESFTSYWDWQEGPSDLKPLADRAFCEGMNRLVIHGFSHNPAEMGSPGIAYFAGTHYNDKTVWWPKSKPFNDYLARISYVLQKTKFVADVLHYYGDEVPNLIPPKNARFTAGPGYDYEVINTEVLLKELTVEDGQLVLPGVARYRVLSVGDQQAMNPQVLSKLRELAEKGAVIIGRKPETTHGLRSEGADRQIAESAGRLWLTSSGSDFREKGKIYPDQPPVKVLQSLGIPPDFTYPDAAAGTTSAPLDYIHYATEEADFYLIRNTTDQWISRLGSFRQKDKVPQIWDPLTGEVLPVPVYRQEAGQIRLPVSLPPQGAYFVVFRKGTPGPHHESIGEPGTPLPLIHYTQKGALLLNAGPVALSGEAGTSRITQEARTVSLEGPWEIRFPKGWGAPESAVFPKLISWSKAENPGIRYFSGTATYRKTFPFGRKADPSTNRIYLDLGSVSKLAEVWLNDRPLGITWTRPYRVDITDIVREGANTLRIEVANTWSNRLTGDAVTGEKYTNTNIAKANRNLTPWAQLPLIESGLLGPVTIQTVSIIPQRPQR